MGEDFVSDDADLAGRDHWDGLYSQVARPEGVWRPTSYDELALDAALHREIERGKPRSILEVGCGNSTWLPYLSKEFDISRIGGLDYSPRGCELARARLSLAGVEGRITCGDVHKIRAADLGTYDFVYSLGVVEHFSDLLATMRALREFVGPGGILFTEVPNIWSVHGLMCWMWQPDLLAKHRIVRKQDLVSMLSRLGMRHIRAGYLGFFSLGLVAWEVEPRWPRLATAVAPMGTKLQTFIGRGMRKFGPLTGPFMLAPFVYAAGDAPAAGPAPRCAA